MNAREAAYTVLEAFFIQGIELEKTIDEVFDQEFLSGRDKKLAFEIIHGVFRTKKQLDAVIDKYLNSSLQTDAKCRLIIEIGAYQMLFLDKIPIHAATNEAVNLTKNPQMRHMSGAVNAVLRRIATEGKKTLKATMDRNDWSSLSEELCVRFSHPEWLVDRWLAQLGGTKTRKLLQFNNTQPDVYIRRMTKRTDKKRFEADIASATPTSPLGVGYKGLYYKMISKIHAPDLDSFKTGNCTIQAPSSGWVVAMVDPKPGEHILDMCSAPGGKACMIADLEQEATVIAADLNLPRMMLVLETILRLGQINITPMVMDGTIPSFNYLFDKVLLDAPCTGTGVFHRHPESRWLRDGKALDNAVKLQKKLFGQAASLVKPGGVLVYATCSLEPEENEEQVAAFLEHHPEFVLETAADFVESKFVTTKKCMAITPYTHNMDGMFAARLRKREL